MVVGHAMQATIESFADGLQDLSHDLPTLIQPVPAMLLGIQATDDDDGSDTTYSDDLSSAFGIDPNEGLSDLMYSGALDLAIGIVCFVVFCLIHGKKIYKWAYSPRLDPVRLRMGSPWQKPPPALPEGWASWIPHIYKIPESVIYETVGYDAIVYLRFLKMCMWFFLICTIPGMVVLLPLNYLGGGDVEGINQLTISNITDGDSSLYAHLTMAYVFSLLFLYQMWDAYKTHVSTRHEWLQREQLQNRRMCIMISKVPEELRTDEAFADYFQQLFPATFKSAVLVRDVSQLEALVARRDTTKGELDRYFYQLEQTGDRPNSYTCLCCNQTDAIETYKMILDRYNVAIQDKLNEDFPVLDLGFVTFKSSVSTSLLAKIPVNATPAKMRAEIGPEPGDIYYPSIYRSDCNNALRYWFIVFVVFVLILLWTIPVAFCASLSNLESLSKEFPWLESFLKSSSFVRSFITGYLPTILLAGFINLVPVTVRIIIRFEGSFRWTWMQESLLNKFFVFLIINFFFVVILSTSLFSVFTEFWDNPSEIPAMLGHALPKTSTFFINYIMLRAFASMPLLLFRFGPFFLAVWRKCWARTPAEHVYAERPHVLDYGQDIPPHLLILLLGVCYACVAPLALPFCVVYFALCHFVFKYLILYCYIPEVESGGDLFPNIFSKSVVSLLLAQTCLIGIFWLKDSHILAFMLVPLPIITCVCWWYFHHKFYTIAQTVPVEAAQATDKQRIARELHKQHFDGDDSEDEHQDEAEVDRIERGRHSSTYFHPALLARPLQNLRWDTTGDDDDLYFETEASRRAAGADLGDGLEDWGVDDDDNDNYDDNRYLLDGDDEAYAMTDLKGGSSSHKSARRIGRKIGTFAHNLTRQLANSFRSGEDIAEESRSAYNDSLNQVATQVFTEEGGRRPANAADAFQFGGGSDYHIKVVDGDENNIYV